MKKKVSGVVVMAAIAIIAGWSLNESKSKVILTDLALENVEALANNEGGGGGWWCCGYWGNCENNGTSYIHGLFRVTPC